MEVATVGDDYDFASLRDVNRDTDGSVISVIAESFIDAAAAILNRVPADWKSGNYNLAADIQGYIQDHIGMTNNIASLTERPVGERSARLTALQSEIQSLLNRQINSMTHFVRLLVIGDSMRDSAGEVATFRDRAFAEVQKAQEASGKIGSLLQAAEAAAAQTGVSGNAAIFGGEAQSANTKSNIWLAVAVALSLIVIVVAAKFSAGELLSRPESGDAFALANYVLAKVLILGTMLFGLTFATRQYGAYRHNAVMNQHRSNALNTYRTIVEASRSEGAHDIILAEAAEAIFKPQDSGFVKSGTGDGPGVVQLVQGLMKGAGSAPPH